MELTKEVSSHMKPVARAGLIAKGVVYCLLGILTFMAAFHLAGQSAQNADKGGVFSFIYKQTGGIVVLAIIALGLVCYSIWRLFQALGDSENKGKDAKGLAARARYLFSALVYLSVAFAAGKVLLEGRKTSGDSQQSMAEELISKPAGQWLVGIAALIFLSVGVYQIYYALSEKYKKHIESNVKHANQKLFSVAAKTGYIARGLVWLTISWLFFKAAVHSNSSEAGDTSKAFTYLSGISYGEYILALVGLGLICYGIFNFIRVRYENLSGAAKNK